MKTITVITATLGELAANIGVSPGDVADAAISAGVKSFDFEGLTYDLPENLSAFLGLCEEEGLEPMADVCLHLMASELSRLAVELSVSSDELRHGMLPEDKVIDANARRDARIAVSLGNIHRQLDRMNEFAATLSHPLAKGFYSQAVRELAGDVERLEREVTR